MSHADQFKHLKIKLEAIKLATNNFSADNCIGHGGFGKVYKGELVHYKGESMVALKRLDPAFGQGNSEFWKEIMMLSFYRHENIVSLVGYCDDHGEKILAYEYASNKSLDSYISSADLTWVQRLKICVGASRGLAYLHTPADTKLRILHRDIKSSNILLDSNWNAKISDFGLSKFAPANSQFTFLISNPAGTPVYIDPEYQETGLLTQKTDVYSFGVVLFEVFCGRLCFGNKNLPPLIGLVREYYSQSSKIRDLAYSSIRGEMNTSSLDLYVDLAYKCLKRNPKERPSMSDIVSKLEEALDIQVRADTSVHGSGILHLKVTGRRIFNASNLYLVLWADENDPLENIRTTTLKVNEMNAVLNENLSLYVKCVQSQSVYIAINQVVSTKKHRQLRITTMGFYNLCFGERRTYSFNPFEIEVLFEPTNAQDLFGSVQRAPIGTPIDGGCLVIIICRARFYSKYEQDSSVSLLFRGETRKTRCVMETGFPIWLQEFRFILQQPPTDEILHLEVISNSWTSQILGNGSFGSFGYVDISLADVVKEKWTNKDYELEPSRLTKFYYRKRGKYYLNHELTVELQWRT